MFRYSLWCREKTLKRVSSAAQEKNIVDNAQVQEGENNNDGN
jgi:hypothetical protein